MTSPLEALVQAAQSDPLLEMDLAILASLIKEMGQKNAIRTILNDRTLMENIRKDPKLFIKLNFEELKQQKGFLVKLRKKLGHMLSAHPKWFVVPMHSQCCHILERIG